MTGGGRDRQGDVSGSRYREAHTARCAFYLRLSREDGSGESNSIRSQRLLLEQYLRVHTELVYAGEWVDDGWSGSDYERPGFQAMMRAVARGEIQCILCKDLSRLGREYIQTGQYLREIFPRLGLRFIAVADQYDSAREEFLEESLLFPVVNLMNDAYCRDISNKVRWQQRARRQMGEYIGAFACYGYQKAEHTPHRLQADETAAEVVRVIFLLRLSGMAAEKIACVLNAGRISGPRAYKRNAGSRYRSGFDRDNGQQEPWSPQAVRRILQNQMYTGVMIQGKDRKLSYKLKKRVRLPEEEWVKVEGCVPPIIPAWEFSLTEQLRHRAVRCGRGGTFCEPFAGYGLAGKGQLACVRICQSLLRESTLWQESMLWPAEPYLRRLWVTLHIASVTASEERGIYRFWLRRRAGMERIAQ